MTDSRCISCSSMRRPAEREENKEGSGEANKRHTAIEGDSNVYGKIEGPAAKQGGRGNGDGVKTKIRLEFKREKRWERMHQLIE